MQEKMLKNLFPFLVALWFLYLLSFVELVHGQGLGAEKAPAEELLEKPLSRLKSQPKEKDAGSFQKELSAPASGLACFGAKRIKLKIFPL